MGLGAGPIETKKEPYPESTRILEEMLGNLYNSIKPFLHFYDGSNVSVKPVSKNITIYWVGRAADRMILRTEGEDDVILSQVGSMAVPTIIFRKLKAVYLREFMQLMRMQWIKHSNMITKDAGYKGDFLQECSIAVGIRGEEKGTMHGRCMRCPTDVLMGATSGGASYNLHSRFMGDAAYALTPSTERRTGNAVDEITYTTIMIGRQGSEREEERRTGGLFSETFVEPGTVFVGKIVLPMISPPELLHVLWLLTRVSRIGGRTSIQGTLEVYPVAMIGDLFEVGTSYELAEKLQGKKDLREVRAGVLEYVNNEVKYKTSSGIIEITKDITSKLRMLDILDSKLVKELWENATNYVKGVEAYITASARR